jgi:hypothetical protein
MCVFKLEKTTVIPNFFLKICNSRTTLVLRYRERQTSLTAQYYFHWGKDMELLVIPAYRHNCVDTVFVPTHKPAT